MLRAKMKCQSVADYNYGPDGAKSGESMRLDAVAGVDATANAQWAKYTPSGSVTLSIDNPDAWGQLKVGSFYFVDLTETTEEA